MSELDDAIVADEYTPTDGQVREEWVAYMTTEDGLWGGLSEDEAEAAWGRWLAARDREVAAKALRDFRAGFGRRFGFQDPYGHFESGTVSALHRQVEGILDAEIARIEKGAGDVR